MDLSNLCGSPPVILQGLVTPRQYFVPKTSSYTYTLSVKLEQVVLRPACVRRHGLLVGPNKGVSTNTEQSWERLEQEPCHLRDLDRWGSGTSCVIQ